MHTVLPYEMGFVPSVSLVKLRNGSRTDRIRMALRRFAARPPKLLSNQNLTMTADRGQQT